MESKILIASLLLTVTAGSRANYLKSYRQTRMALPARIGDFYALHSCDSHIRAFLNNFILIDMTVTKKKPPIEELMNQFGKMSEVTLVLKKVFQNHVTSDEFSEQGINERKNDLFWFDHLLKFLNSSKEDRS